MAKRSPAQIYTDRVLDSIRSYKDYDRAAKALHISREKFDKIIDDIINVGIDQRPASEIKSDLNRSSDAVQVFDREGKNYHIHSYRYLEGQNLPEEKDGRRYQAVITGHDKAGNERKYTTSLFNSMSGALAGAAQLSVLYDDDTFDDFEIQIFDALDDFEYEEE